ncbi:MAG: Hsp20/alpha crystallin family protein [Candidatus Binatia bacterium]
MRNEVTDKAAERAHRRMPAVEICADANALYLSAKVPGLAATSTRVTVEDGVLTVRGRVQQPEPAGAVTECARRFALRDPARYDTAQISANLRHGVLQGSGSPSEQLLSRATFR